MDIGNIRRDVAKIEQGDWVDDIPGMGDLRLLVRGMSAPEVIAHQSALSRSAPAHKRNRDNSLTVEASTEIMALTIAEKVLLGWENLECDGEQVEFSVDLAKQFMTNAELSPFADAVVWAANVVDRSKAARAEDTSKNSPVPLRGASTKAKTATA